MMRRISGSPGNLRLLFGFLSFCRPPGSSFHNILRLQRMDRLRLSKIKANIRCFRVLAKKKPHPRATRCFLPRRKKERFAELTRRPK